MSERTTEEKSLSDRLRYWADRYDDFWPPNNPGDGVMTKVMREAASALERPREPITRVVIPTDTMEQEFQSHYRRGFESGRKQPPEPAADLPTMLMAQSTQRLQYIHRLEAALRSIAANTCCGPCREAGLVAFEALHGKQPETKEAKP